MDANVAPQFSKVNNVRVEESFGDYFVTIEAGTYCVFNKTNPSNGLHHHSCYEICLVTGGEGEFVHGTQMYRLKKGDVFIAEPNVVHEIHIGQVEASDCSGTLCLVFFRIHISCNSRVSANKKGLSEEGKNHFRALEEELLDEFVKDHSILASSQKQLFSYLHFLADYEGQSTLRNYSVYQMVKNMALECLFSLNRRTDNHYQKQPHIESIVDKAVNYVGANLHRRIFLQEIADFACTSQRNLQNHFRRYMDMPITDYINKRRVAVAAGYLKMNFRVNDVCNIIGINDVSQFSRLFKKYTGIAPKKYQSLNSSEGMAAGAAFHCR